jgi:hypothetical protein
MQSPFQQQRPQPFVGGQQPRQQQSHEFATFRGYAPPPAVSVEHQRPCANHASAESPSPLNQPAWAGKSSFPKPAVRESTSEGRSNASFDSNEWMQTAGLLEVGKRGTSELTDSVSEGRYSVGGAINPDDRSSVDLEQLLEGNSRESFAPAARERPALTRRNSSRWVASWSCHRWQDAA